MILSRPLFSSGLTTVVALASSAALLASGTARAHQPAPPGFPAGADSVVFKHAIATDLLPAVDLLRAESCPETRGSGTQGADR